MANEAYRAVCLRIHPTGKMVLSLTTEADGGQERVTTIDSIEHNVELADDLFQIPAEISEATPRPM